MRIAVFSHSLLSDWNHGNAHFLRGIVSELERRGHAVWCYEPADGWSIQNLIHDHGCAPLEAVQRLYPRLRILRYRADTLTLEAALADIELAVVHEWNSPQLVRDIGNIRQRFRSFRLFFHDTHHRSVSAPNQMHQYDLSGYDGALVFGESVRDAYQRHCWSARVWTWHEAADTTVFRPDWNRTERLDLVWVGNWGDEERTEELYQYLIRPSRTLGLSTRVYGVRYPNTAQHALRHAGIDYGGWLPNHRVAAVLQQSKFTVHVPRRPYVQQLPGVPTIRIFEALASGVPLATAPWSDTEGLFAAGRDFLIARDEQEMTRHLRALRDDAGLRQELARNGWARILQKHTCSHRVDQLMQIYKSVANANDHHAH